MSKPTEAAKDLEQATECVKKSVQNVKDAADTAKTIDPHGAAIALGLSIFGTFMAPHLVPKEKKVVDVITGPDGPV